MAMEYCYTCDTYRDLDYEDHGYWLDEYPFHYKCDSCVDNEMEEEEDDGQPDEAQEWYDYDPE